MSIILKPGVNEGLSNAQYHSEKLHLSSSNLKTLLKSPAQFYDEKILGNSKPMSGAALDIGSYVHTLILEPELVAQEYVQFDGWRRQGKVYEDFKAQHPGKTVLSQPQMNAGQMLARSVQACPPAVHLLKGGAAELSLASEILGVPVKMRADYINPDAGYILDVKTTRWPSGADTFRRTVKELGYELSAALYCEIAYRVYGKIFDFYWLVVSKTDVETQVYKASTHSLSDGSALVNKALVAYKKCLETGVWPDTLEQISSAVGDFEILEI